MYILGISFMGAATVVLLVLMVVLRRRHVRNARRAQEERDRRRAERAAVQLAEQEARAATMPIKTIEPFVVLHPNGEMVIGEKLDLEKGLGDSPAPDAGSVSGDGSSAPPQPAALGPSAWQLVRSLSRSRTGSWRQRRSSDGGGAPGGPGSASFAGLPL